MVTGRMQPPTLLCCILHMKRLYKTEPPISFHLCVLHFQRQPFRFVFRVLNNRNTYFLYGVNVVWWKSHSSRKEDNEIYTLLFLHKNIHTSVDLFRMFRFLDLSFLNFYYYLILHSLTHLCWMDSSTINTCIWTCLFHNRGCLASLWSVCFIEIPRYIANSVDPDHLGLHSLPLSLLRDARR